MYILNNNNKSVIMMEEQVQSEITRIISSDNQLVSQLKHYNSYQSRIEQELLNKTTQISKLQNYLRKEISNIQIIVEENNSLKQEMQVKDRQWSLKNEENNALREEIVHLVKTNHESQQTVSTLQRRVKQLQQTLSTKNMIIGRRQNGTQTIKNSQEPSGNFNSNNNLLEKIASLEEMIMKLKFQKNQLQQKMGESRCSEIQNQDQTSIYQQKLDTQIIMNLLNQNSLKEIKFKGEVINGFKQGKGVCQYQNHILYKGEFYSNNRHGLGAIEVYGQVLYRGQWRNGVMQGKGFMSMLEGEIQSYQGHFNEGKLEGYGCMKLKSGKRLTALWKDGRIIGNCLEMIGEIKRYRNPEMIECY